MIKENGKEIEQVRDWLHRTVIGLNLCPFANKPFSKGLVRIVSVNNTDLNGLSHAINQELDLLVNSNACEIETSLLITPELLQSFDDYLDFAYFVEEMIREKALEGVIQLATFHPNYVFDGEASEAKSHYTNRSPYPIFHFLREKEMELAIAKHKDVDLIPSTNIKRLTQMSDEDFEYHFSLLEGSDNK